MNKLYSFYTAIILIIAMTTCVNEDSFDNSPKGNFEQLWKIIDEHYCFLDYKNKEYGLDWDAIYTTYKNRIASKMTNKELFDVLSDMVNELHDGHVNLVSKDRTSQYRIWYDAYPRNFNDSIQSIYLGKDYLYSSGLKYCILDDNIGYIYCGSFGYTFGNSALDEILTYLSACNGLIIDVRNNGGGNLTSAETLASRFTNKKILTGYMQYKTGKGHHDFSSPEAVYTDTPTNRVRWQKPVAVLTNRRSYSATNDFVNRMSQFDNVTIIGDKTGGGSGLPFTSEISNGWSIRFSACPMFDPSMNQIEFGIDPDIKADITSDDYNRGIDTIIERARALLIMKANQ